MLALSDHANEDGNCYPSIARLCQRTGLSERAVQSNIRALTEAGYLTVLVGGGKGNANSYYVNATPETDTRFDAVKPRSKRTPQEMPPAEDAPETPHFLRSNPAGNAPEPSGTTIEPSLCLFDARHDAASEAGQITAPSPFLTFWERWPHKVNKRAAEKAWSKLKAEKQAEALTALGAGWFDRWQAANSKASPIHPATFLNGERWNDEFDTKPRPDGRIAQGRSQPDLAAAIAPAAPTQSAAPAPARAQARDQNGNPAHMNVGRLGRPVRYYGEDFIVTDNGAVYQGGKPVADVALANAVRGMMDPETASIPTGAAPPIKNPLPMGVAPAGLDTRAAEAIRGKYQPAKDADALLKAGKITQQEHSMLTRGDLTAQDAVIARMRARGAGQQTPDLPMSAPAPKAGATASPAPQASQGAASPATMPLGAIPSAPPSNIPIKAFAKPSDKAASATAAATLEQGASPAAKAATTTATQAMGVQPGQRTISDAQYQRGSKAWADRYLEVGAPVYFEALVREGEFDKAKAFQEWMQTAETNRAMKDVGTSVTAFLLGDADKGAAHMVAAFNNLGYYPDGTTVEKSQFTKGNDGEINGLIITLKDGKSGHTFEQVFNGGVDDLLSSLLPAMMPEQAFEHVFAMREAAQKGALGAIERSDKLSKDQAEEDKAILKAAQDLVKDAMPPGSLTLDQAVDQVLAERDKVRVARGDAAISGATWMYRPN